MKKTSLFDIQKALGAEFDEYYTWQLPKVYSGVAEEYTAARHTVVLMDRSYYGHLRVSGKDHVDLLHRMTTNELRNLQPGEGQINVFANEKGRMIDRVILYKFDDDIRLLTSPQNPEKIAAWIDKFTFIEDVQVENLTSQVTMFTLFGPKSIALLNFFFQSEFEELQNHHFKEIPWQDTSVIVARTEELGEPGFNLMLPDDLSCELWENIISKGSDFNLKPMGEDAYHVLRIEAGWPLFETDYTEEINPHEALLEPYLNFTKGCYIGQEVIARLNTYEKVQKKLLGFILEGSDKPKARDPIFIHGQQVGFLTSVTYSLALNKIIALGYVYTKFISEEAEVLIKSEDQEISGKLVNLPFINLSPKRALNTEPH